MTEQLFDIKINKSVQVKAVITYSGMPTLIMTTNGTLSFDQDNSAQWGTVVLLIKAAQVHYIVKS